MTALNTTRDSLIDALTELTRQAPAVADRYVASMSKLMLRQPWRISAVIYNSQIFPPEKPLTEMLADCERRIVTGRRLVAAMHWTAGNIDLFGLMAARDALLAKITDERKL